MASSSGSGQEAQVDGFGGDEEGPSFGLHHRQFIFELHLVGLHQLREDTNESTLYRNQLNAVIWCPSFLKVKPEDAALLLYKIIPNLCHL